MIRIAVIDDEKEEQERLLGYYQRLREEVHEDLDIHTYLSGDEFLSVQEEPFDLICLDIDMPKLDGVSLGKAIRENSPETEIIFVSNREDRVFDTILNVRPFGFVRKNNFSSDLMDTLRAYISSKIDTNHYFVVKTDNNSVTRSLRVVDVVYIESFKDHQFIYMQDGEKIDIRMTMDELEQELSKYDIVRTHKGYLVNLKYIRRIDGSGITLSNGAVVGLSRTKVQEVKAQYLKYLRKTGASLINK